MAIKDQFKKLTIGGAMLTAAALPFAASADNSAQVNYTNSPIAADYVQDCQSGHCAPGEAAAWSALEENKNAVAVAVAMGTDPIMSDYQIKHLIESGLKHHGIKKVQFFFEQNDAVATGITFHVRGGTHGPHRVTNDLIKIVPEMASYAKNENPVLALN